MNNCSKPRLASIGPALAGHQVKSEAELSLAFVFSLDVPFLNDFLSSIIWNNMTNNTDDV